MSTLVEEGPGAVAMHAVNNARQLLMLPEPDLGKVLELLAPVPDLILRQQTHIERLEPKNAALNEALNEANTRLATASSEVEHLYLVTSLEMDRKTTVFNNVARLREALDPSAAACAPNVTITQPRAAAAGSR